MPDTVYKTPVPIRVLIADDHDLVLCGLADILEPEPDIRIVGAIKSGEALLEEVARTRPNVILCDIRMPHFDIFQFATRLQNLARIKPHLYTAEIILITGYANAYLAHRAHALKIRGYLLKEEALSSLLPDAIRRVHSHQKESIRIGQYYTFSTEQSVQDRCPMFGLSRYLTCDSGATRF